MDFSQGVWHLCWKDENKAFVTLQAIFFNKTFQFGGSFLAVHLVTVETYLHSFCCSKVKYGQRFQIPVFFVNFQCAHCQNLSDIVYNKGFGCSIYISFSTTFRQVCLYACSGGLIFLYKMYVIKDVIGVVCIGIPVPSFSSHDSYPIIASFFSIFCWQFYS